MRFGPGGAYPRNAQTFGQPVMDQKSLTSPKKRLICYLSLCGKIAATAMDKELNTRQDVLGVLYSVLYMHIKL